MTQKTHTIGDFVVTFTADRLQSKWGWGCVNIANARFGEEDVMLGSQHDDWASSSPNIDFTASLFNIHEHVLYDAELLNQLYDENTEVTDKKLLELLKNLALSAKAVVTYRQGLPIYVGRALDAINA